MSSSSDFEKIRHLKSRIEELEKLALLPGRTLLATDDATLDGYMTLEREERRFSSHAIGQHADLILVWYDLLNCFKAAVNGWNEADPDLPDEMKVAEQMAMQMSCMAGGTAKLVMDSATAGYYVQSFALIRHLFETWLRLEYIWLRPEESKRWFVSDSGAQPQPPGENRINNYLRKHSPKEMQPAVESVMSKLQLLNKMAHPSELSFQQSVGARPGSFAVGANYDFPMAIGAFHDGSGALIYLIRSMYRFGRHDESLRTDLNAVNDRKNRIMDRYTGELDEYRRAMTEQGHWILGTPGEM